ncbi:hypothetical protein [Psychromonas sp. B3M02]|uniref:hypothetical protein n=1 Tax=Psychromonas sp. B3M02 TaxID=2267226 RepID=UPI0011BF17DF|nr:hypothetical protein [Psychromonas sp. B3M02]
MSSFFEGNFKCGKLDERDFSSDDPILRIAALYKKINISRFSETKSISRKQLYKMRDSGFVPRTILLDMCQEARISPVLVEFSPKERLMFFSDLCSYIKESDVNSLFEDALENHEDKTTISLLNLLHNLYKSGDISDSVFQNKMQKILSAEENASIRY